MSNHPPDPQVHRRWRHDPHGLAAAAAANGDPTALLALDADELREGPDRPAEERAALRRVATLVDQGPAPTQVFDAVVEEVAQLFGAAQVGLMRFEGSNEITMWTHYAGNPEELARHATSFTGKYLAPMLKGSASKSRGTSNRPRPSSTVRMRSTAKILNALRRWQWPTR